MRARRSGAQPATSVQRFLPDLDVDVRRRGRGHDQVGGRDPAGGDVADEGGAAVLVQVADVVGGVAGGVGDAHPTHRLAAAEHVHVGLRHRHDLAPEPLHLVAVEALGAGQQLRGVDQVRGAALVHVDLEVGPAATSAPVAAAWSRWIWVSRTARGCSSPIASITVVERGLRPGVDQDPVDLPAADHVRPPEVHDVDYAHTAKLPQAAAARGTAASGFERLPQALLQAARRVAELALRPSRSWPRR